jgi:hypothetical protein
MMNLVCDLCGKEHSNPVKFGEEHPTCPNAPGWVFPMTTTDETDKTCEYSGAGPEINCGSFVVEPSITGRGASWDVGFYISSGGKFYRTHCGPEDIDLQSAIAESIRGAMACANYAKDRVEGIDETYQSFREAAKLAYNQGRRYAKTVHRRERRRALEAAAEVGSQAFSRQEDFEP